ncbi:MAG: Cof-type HAD-IIB family hydrolase [Coriobacteriaceae bacterium]|nr:Cof-type HAD-IIB family hydrolase [Coriobacteriaceae bacterium]MCI6845374.1 Cof-type HAD-IIB family hydrolase [Coriobacteriaceae bacterium]MDD7584488.1 HAD family hydrolase [Coriobacteriaceae bacterium]
MIKLVLSDMDNTLIPFGARHVSPRTLEAIHDVTNAGVHFGPATGRDYVELMRFFHMDESCFMTGIMSNGKRVRVDGRDVWTYSIPHEWLDRIAAALKPERGMFLICYPMDTNLFNPAYVVGASEEEMNEYERLVRFTGGRVVDVPAGVDIIAAAVACNGDEERHAYCQRLIAEACPEVETVMTVPNWFDVLPLGINKASALDIILDAVGATRDETVVFGDSGNDVAILGEVHYSVAVANATDEVKRVSNFRCGASADEGVADALFEIARAARAHEVPSFLKEE